MSIMDNTENLNIREEDKLEFFDEIMCKIQSKRNKNPETDYLTDFIDFIELYTTIIQQDEDETEYVIEHPFYYNDIKNLTILEEFHEILDNVLDIDCINCIDEYNVFNYLVDFNIYIYYDFNYFPKKIFTKRFINDFKMYIYNNLTHAHTLK